MIKIKNSRILSKYKCKWSINNQYRWAMSQKLPVNGFKWVENASQFNEDFIRTYGRDIITEISNL